MRDADLYADVEHYFAEPPLDDEEEDTATDEEREQWEEELADRQRYPARELTEDELGDDPYADD